MSQNPILVFNVTQKDRVKKLYIGCHFPNQSVSKADGGFNGAEAPDNFYAITPANSSFFSVKSPTGFFVEMPIEYIHFNFGGETRVFTLNQLQLLNAGSIIANKHYLQEHTEIRAFKYVLVLDMERMIHDVFGSSNQSAMNI
jgi:hypothetical protein